MADVLVKPAFQSGFTDGGDATKLRPSAWNAARLFTGGTNGDLLTRDSGSATGASWVSQSSLSLALTTTANVFSASQSITKDALAAVSTDGVVLQNTTASTAGVPVQIPPRLRLRGHAWNTTGSVDNTDDWWLESLPISSASPTSSFKILRSLNGGAAVAVAVFTDGGTLTLNGGLVVGSAITLGSGQTLRFAGVRIEGTVASQLNLLNTAQTVGVGLDFATDAILKVRTRAQTGYATVDALAYRASGVAGVSFGPAAPASLTIVNGIVTAAS